jgi:uncharacterized protein YukE
VEDLMERVNKNTHHYADQRDIVEAITETIGKYDERVTGMSEDIGNMQHELDKLSRCFGGARK